MPFEMSKDAPLPHDRCNPCRSQILAFEADGPSEEKWLGVASTYKLAGFKADTHPW